MPLFLCFCVPLMRPFFRSFILFFQWSGSCSISARSKKKPTWQTLGFCHGWVGDWNMMEVPTPCRQHYFYHYCIFAGGGFQSWPLIVHYFSHYFIHWSKFRAKNDLMNKLIRQIMMWLMACLKDPITVSVPKVPPMTQAWLHHLRGKNFANGKW